MDTYTITEAARLVGTSRGKLYQAIRTSRLQAAPRQEPSQALTVTAAALQAAGFAVPAAALPHPPAAPDTAPAPAALSAPATEERSTAEIPANAPTPAPPAAAPPSATPEQALIAHLERALEQAQERERRLLDLLAHLTGQPSAPPAAASRLAAPPLLSGLRAQIVTVLQPHPEGLSPKAVRTLLQVDQDVRSTMKGMVRSGILTRRAAGCYVVAGGR